MGQEEFGLFDEEGGMEYFMRKGYKRKPELPIPVSPIDITNRKLDEIKRLLSLLVAASQNKGELDIKNFNTGITNLPNAVVPTTTTPIDPANTTPTTGYTLVEVNTQKEPNRNAKELYFLNLGPATIFVIVSHIKNIFIGQEFPVFARNATIFHDVYELRVRTELANTRFIASEHPLQSLPAQQFADRDATPRHLLQPFAAFGPHGQIIRQQYTVPTGFQAQVSGAYIFLQIGGAAAVPGRRNMTIGYTSIVSGVPITGSIMSRSIPPSENTVGALVDTAGGSEIGFSYLLQEGESINIQTGDASTGGFLFYFGSVLITEYFPIG